MSDVRKKAMFEQKLSIIQRINDCSEAFKRTIQNQYEKEKLLDERKF